MRAAARIACVPLALPVSAASALELEPTPFVERSAKGPMRRVNVRLAQPSAGRLSYSLGAFHGTQPPAETSATHLLVPEPDHSSQLRVSFEPAQGGRWEAGCQLEPARHWTFFLTPHTHYDIGYTAPQPKVIEQLTADMDHAVKYCEETSAWPEGSRYRWTVEVSGLMKNYIDRRGEREVARFMELVRAGAIEICAYYLNMPTEVTGHEETIRCLYYAEELRKRFGVRIDTAIIDDVPGYTWSLADLFVSCGVPRVSFRANSINGRFLWYRPGAAPRPFYWEGPAGGRLFTWYTHTYRDGNFFRAPGLHEEEFIRLARRDEAAGATYDEIQLRMGGDNLPPDINASRNARAWKEKYIWPRVVVATNREFLELLETRRGAAAKTFRGDIPSWWADGPGSAALENGINRLTHDRLVAAEALWTAAFFHLGAAYPRQEILEAYDQMIHFDEHTWGASDSISHPTSENSAEQWRNKATYGKEAARRTNELLERGVAALTRAIAARAPNSFALWNTLGWRRTDIAELPVAGTRFETASGLRIIDTRSGKRVPAQKTSDGKALLFLAEDVPALGHVTYAVEPAAPDDGPTAAGGLENRFFKIAAAPEKAGLTSIFDKLLNRELLDRGAQYAGNQPIYEQPPFGREGIDNVRARAEVDKSLPPNTRVFERAEFDRCVPSSGTLIHATRGPVFAELEMESRMPPGAAPGRYGSSQGYPWVRQRIRIYDGLKCVDILNTVTHEEVFTPESLYFAFPFDVRSPEFRVQIANAVMRPGKDQLPYSCQDYYAIQQWVDVSGEGIGVTLAPVEAPLVTLGGLNVRAWADRLPFDKAHIYSWVMNNYWFTNFKAAQRGVMPFRYRLTSYEGAHDSAAASRFAWQPFHPLHPVWLDAGGSAGKIPDSLISIEGDPVLLSCLKRTEAGNDAAVRLLEICGRTSRCTVRFPGKRIRAARSLNAVEKSAGSLPVRGGGVTINLRANEICTVAFELENA